MRTRARTDDQRGFTLIELLVTISIIGILAGIAAFGVAGIRSKSARQACASDVQAVQLALDTYRTKNKAYPVDGPALVTAGVVKQLDNSDSYDVDYTRLTTSTYRIRVYKAGTTTLLKAGNPDVVADSTTTVVKRACST